MHKIAEIADFVFHGKPKKKYLSELREKKMFFETNYLSLSRTLRGNGSCIKECNYRLERSIENAIFLLRVAIIILNNSQ